MAVKVPGAHGAHEAEPVVAAKEPGSLRTISRNAISAELVKASRTAKSENPDVEAGSQARVLPADGSPLQHRKECAHQGVHCELPVCAE